MHNDVVVTSSYHARCLLQMAAHGLPQDYLTLNLTLALTLHACCLLQMAAKGLLSLPQLAEIYPVGGAGDRLGLLCDVTQEPLPAAMLPYCGRLMLEGLVRDLQVRH